MSSFPAEISSKVTKNKGVRALAGVIAGLFFAVGLLAAAKAFVGLVGYAVGHPIEPVLDLPLNFFDAAQAAPMHLTGGASPITVTAYSGTFQGETIVVLARRELDRAQEYHPAIRAAVFDAQVAHQSGRTARAFDAVLSVPGYYMVKILSSLALGAVAFVILLFCLGRHQALFDLARKYLVDRKEAD